LATIFLPSHHLGQSSSSFLAFCWVGGYHCDRNGFPWLKHVGQKQVSPLFSLAGGR